MNDRCPTTTTEKQPIACTRCGCSVGNRWCAPPEVLTVVEDKMCWKCITEQRCASRESRE